ncbi:protein-export chaperone SecB [Tepidamorphus sp. 3E244]|uniref:protein-export chaperone SecB n=1 Tax=Tepidamorphus sp. 3E244 TaxID=3385498 RepID=UPI0038FC2AA6
MADETKQDPAAAAAAAGPSINIITQYIKDLSYESPNPAAAMQKFQGKAPPMNVAVNVGGKALSDSDYEVDLSIEAKAGDGDNVVFNLELVYSAIMRVENVSKEQLHPIVFIEGPRMLFPFARQIVANTTGAGGVPPVLLQPIDFIGLYRQRVQQMSTSGENSGTA